MSVQAQHSRDRQPHAVASVDGVRDEKEAEPRDERVRDRHVSAGELCGAWVVVCIVVEVRLDLGGGRKGVRVGAVEPPPDLWWLRSKGWMARAKYGKVGGRLPQPVG